MPRRPAQLLSLGLSAATALLATAPCADAAAALYAPTGHECRLAQLVPGLIAGEALVDRAGYVFDTTEVENGYGTLDNGLTLPLKVGFLSGDAYDRFGALFVGNGQTNATIYRDPAEDPDGCASEAAGRQLAFKAVGVGALDVQRRLFVSATSGSGVRLLDTVANPTSVPVTTNVYIGDLRDANAGSLGSDASTQIEATSSGDGTASPDDTWVVTTDGRSIASDPAVAHVWGSPGADDTVDLVRSGAQSGDLTIDGPRRLGADQLGWAWTDVRIAPGHARSFLSWEAMRASVDGRASTQSALAATAAADIAGAPLSRIYEGLTAAQIGSVANWRKPAASAEITAPTTVEAGADVTFSASDVDFGSTAVAICTTGTLEWDFGDGTKATGSAVSHRFTVEQTAQVTLTVRGTCGGASARRVRVDVAAPVAQAAESIDDVSSAPRADSTSASAREVAPVPDGLTSDDRATDAASLTVNAPAKLTPTDLGKRGLRTTLVATAPGTVRLVLSGGGLKVTKTKIVSAGVETPAALKLSPGAAKRLKSLKKLQLRAKLTLDGGEEIVVSRVINLGR